MDNSGNIKEFKEGEETGEFKHKLTEQQAKNLAGIPKEERLTQLIWYRFQDEVLGGKIDTIQAIKYRNAIKFTVDTLVKADNGKLMK